MRVLLWAGLGGMLLGTIANHRAVDLDVFHAMALFREALAHGELPLADPFAYTPTWPVVVHHEWGAGAAYYAVWEALGLGPLGLSLLRFALLGTIVVLSVRAARRAGATDAALAVCAPAAMNLLVYGLSPVRAQMFTFVFVALLLLLLARDREGDRRWIAPWLVAWIVWVNLHGGFVVGLGVVGVTMAERFFERARSTGPLAALGSVRHLVLVTAAMSALTVVNPYGVDQLLYLARALAMDRPNIGEWAPLWDSRVELMVVLGYVASLALLAYAIHVRGLLSGRGFPLVLVLALAGLLSQRHLPIYAIAWFPVVAAALAPSSIGVILLRFWTDRPRAVAALLLAFAVFGTGTFVARRTWDIQMPTQDRFASGGMVYPVAAVEHLAQAGFAGNLLTRFEDGAYVSWRLYPRVKVSLDSRYEAAYLPGVLEDHLAFYQAASGWEAFLAQHPTDAVLLPCVYSVVARLPAAGWMPAYRDATYCLHVRGDAGAVRAAAAPAP